MLVGELCDIFDDKHFGEEIRTILEVFPDSRVVEYVPNMVQVGDGFSAPLSYWQLFEEVVRCHLK